MMTLSRSFLAGIILFLYFPVFVMVAMAFNESSLYTLPFDPTLRWFEALASNNKLLAASRNSLAIAVATSMIATMIGTMASLALARRRFRGKALLELLLLPPIS